MRGEAESEDSESEAIMENVGVEEEEFQHIWWYGCQSIEMVQM